MGFRNRETNCFLQYFFYSWSCFFFLLLFYFFKTLKLESSVAPPHSFVFCRLAELYTLWNPAWMIQKNTNNSNTENLLSAEGKCSSVLFFCYGLQGFSLFFYLWLKVLSVFLSLSSEWHPSLCTFTYAKNTSGPKVTWRLDSYCMYI